MADPKRPEKAKRAASEMPVQVDPMLRQGRSGSGWTWIVATVILLALLVTFFAIGGTGQQTASKQNSNVTMGAGDHQPPTALPTSRGNGNVPPSGTTREKR